jgi:SAM-dependent methyltransferase
MTDERSANADQIEYWSGPGAKRWTEYQVVLDRSLRPFGDAALALARVQPGERALDVGCGCGETSLELAAAVGPRGAVVGLDVSEGMLALAKQRGAGLGQLRFALGDAAEYVADAPFDLIYSRFGVMFFADPLQAFRRLHAGLVPGGRLVFVCWRAPGENTWGTVPIAAVRRALALPEEPTPSGPGPFAFADAEATSRMLAAAGFEAVRSEAFNASVLFSASGDLEEAVDFGLNAGPAARLLLGASAVEVDRSRDELRRTLAPYRTPNGIALHGGSWLFSARRAATSP